MTNEKLKNFMNFAADAMFKEMDKKSKSIKTEDFKEGTVEFYLPSRNNEKVK